MLYSFLLLGMILDHDHLIDRMGHDDFETRQWAENTLVQHGMKVIPVLRHRQNHPNAEIRLRVRCAIQRIAENEANAFGILPMIDALYYDVGTRKYLCFGAEAVTLEPYLTQAGGRDNYPFDNYRLATRYLVCTWIREGKSSVWIYWHLEWMHVIDTFYDMHYQQGVPTMPGVMGVRPWQRIWLYASRIQS